MNSKTKGFIYGAIAAASYGMNPLFTLPLYAAGMSVDTVLFYRYFFAVIVLGILMKMQHQSFALRKADILPLVIMGLLFSFSSLLLFMSYNYMDAGIASTILFVYPVMVAVIMGAFFKEKISAITVFSILLALAGIALLYQGDGGKPLSTIGIIFVLLSSLSYAIYIVGVNRSTLKNLSTTKLTFYAILFGLSVYIVRLNFLTDLQVIPTAWLWGDVLALAILPTAVSLVCTALAIHYIGSTPTAILGALEPVTALFFGVLLFHEKLTTRKLLCVLAALCGMVFVSGVPQSGLPEAGEATGILLALLSAVLYASDVSINKFLDQAPACERTLVQLAVAALVMIPYILLTEDVAAMALTPLGAVLLLIVGVFHTGWCYSLFFGSMAHLSAQTVVLFSYIDPIVAILLSALLLHEPLGWSGILGAVLVLGSTLISELPVRAAVETK